MLKKITFSLITISAVLMLTVMNVASQPPAIPGKLNDAEIVQQLKNLPGWTIESGQLYRTYQFKNFVEAIEFLNRLVEPSETLNHHPDLAISYNKVTIYLSTHDAGGLTQQDFDLAQIISQLYQK